MGGSHDSIHVMLPSFAVTYKSKLWRNEIAAKKRVMRGKNTTKADIHFHLATSRSLITGKETGIERTVR